MASREVKVAAVWGSAIGGIVLVDIALDRRHDGSTLSETIRWLFRTDTQQGRVAFTTTLGVGAVVLWRHIIIGERIYGSIARLRKRKAGLSNLFQG